MFTFLKPGEFLFWEEKNAKLDVENSSKMMEFLKIVNFELLFLLIWDGVEGWELVWGSETGLGSIAKVNDLEVAVI